MGILKAVATGAEMTPIQIRQVKELKIKTAEAYDKVDAIKAADPSASKVLQGQFKGRAMHFSKADVPFSQFDVYKSRGDAFENVGVHAGTTQAAADRAAQLGRNRGAVEDAISEVRKTDKGVVVPDDRAGAGHVIDVAFRDDKPLLDPKGKVYSEDDARKAILDEIRTPEFFQYVKDKGYWNEIAASESQRLTVEIKRFEERLKQANNPNDKQFSSAELTRAKDKLKKVNDLKLMSEKSVSSFTREDAKEFSSLIYEEYGPLVGEYLSESKGYTHIPYINAGEHRGSTSYIILNPYKNARRVDAAFMSEYGGLKAGVAGAAGAAGLAAQADKSDNKTTVKVKLKSRSAPSGT